MTERVFPMPDLGEGLEEGRIVDWLVGAGDDVALNQPLVEIETAKAVVEIPSPFAGRVVRLHGDEGADVAVGAPLITFEVVGSSGSARATPVVRKLARDLGVALDAIPGSGSEGRVTEEDVRAAAGGSDGRAGGQADEPDRRAIARILERQAAIPQVTTFRTVNCGPLQELREELDVSPLPIVIAALCRVVAEHPRINARWIDEQVEPRATINVGVAVDTERGLVVPVIEDAAGLGIADLAGSIARLAQGVREAPLRPGPSATIAVSNTGSYGSEAGTPLLAPNTSVTLALGVIQPRALVEDGAVVARPATTLSLTFDHRVLDGAAAGHALTDLVDLLQSRERLGGLAR